MQKDKIGQHNRLILRFVTQLFQVQAFTECMRPVMREITQFFEDPDNHLITFSRDIKHIYECPSSAFIAHQLGYNACRWRSKHTYPH